MGSLCSYVTSPVDVEILAATQQGIDKHINDEALCDTIQVNNGVRVVPRHGVPYPADPALLPDGMSERGNFRRQRRPALLPYEVLNGDANHAGCRVEPAVSEFKRLVDNIKHSRQIGRQRDRLTRTRVVQQRHLARNVPAIEKAVRLREHIGSHLPDGRLTSGSVSGKDENDVRHAHRRACHARASASGGVVLAGVVGDVLGLAEDLVLACARRGAVGIDAAGDREQTVFAAEKPVEGDRGALADGDQARGRGGLVRRGGAGRRAGGPGGYRGRWR